MIIPRKAYAAFELAAQAKGLTKLVCTKVPFDGDYILIEECAALKNDIVHIITTIFQQGEIELLIGTKSLLGEGWDAPAINALILASFVGSFVLSNQMRGRAIRTQKGNNDKTGNIWHLACIDTTLANGGDDFDMLARRFKSFVGISFKGDRGIENGMARLNIPDTFYEGTDIEQLNQKTLKHASDRAGLKRNWDAALEKGVSLIEEIKIPFPEDQEYQAVKSMYFDRTIKNLIVSLLIGMVDYFIGMLEGLGRSGKSISTRQDLNTYFSFALIIAVFVFARKAFKAFRLYIKYRDIAKDIQTIGDTLLNTLVSIGIVKTERTKLEVEATVDKFGAVYCYIDGGTTFEKFTFINMLHEITAPIDNPRYVITRRAMFMRYIKQEDFHAVPELIGRNKSTAVYFSKEWQRLVGNCELIFTRSAEGRRLLLNARVKSLAAQFQKRAERINKWQ